MYSRTAAVYDVLYRTIKDYAAEAEALGALMRERVPGATRVLDVACGTGERMAGLRALGFSVDGIDLEPEMVEIAREKNAGSTVERADMTDFDLRGTYDVVLCMFSSIGYVATTARLDTAIASMAKHVAPGGLLVVEPWFEPGVLEDGYVSAMTAHDDGVHVCRMSRTEVDDRLSRIRFEYLIGRRTGIERAGETHELGLFTSEETLSSLDRAGLQTEHDPDWPFGRGLYVAAKPA